MLISLFHLNLTINTFWMELYPYTFKVFSNTILLSQNGQVTLAELYCLWLSTLLITILGLKTFRQVGSFTLGYITLRYLSQINMHTQLLIRVLLGLSHILK